MAQRATSLGPKPSLFIIISIIFNLSCFFLSFLCFLIQKKTVFPWKGIFCLFLSVSHCFSLAFFGLPLFQFLFLRLSLDLVLFLPSCLSISLSFGSLFLSLSFLFYLLCFCFMKGTTSEYKIAKFFFINTFSLFGILSCFFFQIPFSYLCFFLILIYVFLFNINVFGFKKAQVEHTSFWSKGGVATKRCFFMSLCFANCEKLSFWGGHLFGKFWLMFKKNTIKLVFQHILKKTKNIFQSY